MSFLVLQQASPSLSKLLVFPPSRRAPSETVSSGPTCAPCPAATTGYCGDERPWCGPPLRLALWPWRPGQARCLDRLLASGWPAGFPRRCDRHLPPRSVTHVGAGPNSASHGRAGSMGWMPATGLQLDRPLSAGPDASSSRYLQRLKGRAHGV